MLNYNSPLDSISKSMEMPKILPNPLIEIAKFNLASVFAEKLVKRINAFNIDLDPEHEVGIKLVSFGQSIIFYLEDITYSNPSLICLQGKNESGEPVELIQHVSQINIFLMKMPVNSPVQPKKVYGFHQMD
jgi:hypothetical protein